ncbi:MAG: hypothetical protein HY047_10700 [Acidobacteria bacterium]|nr:hypothetical protein [Acidobacteriota bacterium]
METDSGRQIARVGLILTIAILASRLWFIFFRNLDIDEFEHAHATWCVSRGLVPYVDFFEHHTPWLYLLFAPLFRLFNTDADPRAAIALFFVLRLIMWAMTIGCVVCTYVLGRAWRDRFTGILAAFFLTSASQFQDSMLEYRPDVPALLCLLVALIAIVKAWRSERGGTAATLFSLGGFAFGASVLFTQKTLFAAPGLAAALLAYVVDDRPCAMGRWPGRAALVALFALAAAVPAAWTSYWFSTRGALDAFIHYTVTFNVEQNAERFSPFPRLLSHAIHSPLLMALGVGGFAVVVLKRRSEDAGVRLVLPLTAASLFLGVFVFGRVYDQYLVNYFPHLAVFAAAWAPELVSRAGPRIHVGAWLGPAFVVAPVASLAALYLGIDHPGSGIGLAMICAFTLASGLAAAALDAWRRARGSSAASLALLALVAMHYGNLARVHKPIGAQLDELAYVTEHTRPTDAVLSVTSGPGVFRPHAWYYFFLSGPFVTDRDFAELTRAIESGRIRPRIVVLSMYERKLPPAIWSYVRQHYRPVREDLYERPLD